jgi:tryptophan synthase alpha chain
MRERGLEALQAMFARSSAENRAAFMPYYPVGFPDWQQSLDAIAGMAAAGVDGFEIGVPFSDPLADGPVIQEATQIALQNGITVRRCLEAVRTLREQGIQQPMMLMSYANPLIAYGVKQFVEDAVIAGVDGLIIPDLPPEEAERFSGFCHDAGLALVFFLAPTSNPQRIELAAAHATGFIYVVSLTGITGARSDLPEDLTALIERIRALTTTPLVLGFGISTPDHARKMHGLVDGFIVGSALVRAGKQGASAVVDLASTLRQAVL